MPNKKIISLDELSRFKTNCDSEYQETLVSGTNIKTINNTTLLGSGNYTFDDTFNESSTNAVQNQIISKEIREIKYELAVIREDLFETILTEIDYKVDYGYTYAIPDTLSDTDGTHRVVFSETALKTIEFNSVVMNQLVQNGNFADTSFWSDGSGYTFSVSNNEGIFTATTTGGGSIYKNIKSRIENHKYLVHFFAYNPRGYVAIAGLDETYGRIQVSTTEYTEITQIKTSINNGNIFYPFGIGGGNVGDVCHMKDFYIRDLTQMFGVGNEPTTIDDTRIQWLLSLENIPYNTGSLLSTTTTGIQVKDSSDNILGTISVPQTSGRGALNAHDYIEVVEGSIVEGEQLYNLVLHTLVDNVDLGTLNYTKSGGVPQRFSTTDISSLIAKPDNDDTLCNTLCIKYVSSTRNIMLSGSPTNMSVAVSSGGTLYIADGNFLEQTAEQLKTALSGVQLYYQLSTEPTPTIIATDLRFDQISSLIQQGGTINALFTNTPPNVKTTFVVKKAVGE